MSSASWTGAKPDLMVTDPPYGVNYDSMWRYTTGIRTRKGSVVQGNLRNDDDNADWQAAYALFPGRIAYVWMSSLAIPVAARGLDACGFIPALAHHLGQGSHCVRTRSLPLETRAVLVRRQEGGGKPTGRAGRKASTLWEIKTTHGKAETGHSAQKPVECMQRAIHNHKGDVYDPFVGSGTTIIAAEQEQCRCYALEIEPAYVDVSVKRWEDFTGQKAQQMAKRHGR